MDQGVARKAQQEPEGEMEKTETPGAAEAPAYLNFRFRTGLMAVRAISAVPVVPDRAYTTRTRSDAPDADA
jgi:hypothetical protein